MFCTLRISEVLGPCWKHIDWERGAVMVRQRFYRGDLDVPKTRKSIRDVPLGQLVDHLRGIWPEAGHENDFVFSVKTTKGICRDDRDINHYFLLARLKRLGLYWKGLGFHAFRREAITAISREAGMGQAMNAGGHSKADMSLEYTLSDLGEQERAIRAFQARILASADSPEPSQSVTSNKTEQDKLFEALSPEVPDEIRKLLQGLSLNGGLEKTRTSDLFRVKEAL